MKIEIWSDIACPWCYIGKKRFEKALAQFPDADKIEVEWKSFLLNPNQVTHPDDSLAEYLANHKGMTIDQVQQMMAQVTQVGRSEDIDFDFNKVVVANTVRAHALLQFAKIKGKGAEVKQNLLKSYFIQSRNVDDAEQLVKIGVEAGLDREEIKEVLSSDTPFKMVEKDLKEAQALGIQGVPFFVIDRKYGISGAQEPNTFLNALEQAFGEWKEKQQGQMDITEGAMCKPGEEC